MPARPRPARADGFARPRPSSHARCVARRSARSWQRGGPAKPDGPDRGQPRRGEKSRRVAGRKQPRWIAPGGAARRPQGNSVVSRNRASPRPRPASPLPSAIGSEPPVGLGPGRGSVEGKTSCVQGISAPRKRDPSHPQNDLAGSGSMAETAHSSEAIAIESRAQPRHAFACACV